MTLRQFCIEGFRGYQTKVCLDVSNLTAIIGKNDAGKSTILEAMDCFFNETKMDMGDYNIDMPIKEIRLSASFDNLPHEIVIDETNAISLADEYLLDSDGLFTIEKVYKGATPTNKETYVIANHPSNENLNDLLSLKISQLKDRARNLNINLNDIDQTKKSDIRKKIWESQELNLVTQKILIKDEDTKKIAEKIEFFLPLFSLFKSDRPSTDQDSEAQDPMNTAVKEAMKSIESRLKVIERRVEREVKEIANKTVEKLKTMDLDLANELNPVFKTDWTKVFKLSLTGDESIPINKRGSGVRRLILLNFFRVKAEQKKDLKETNNTIYAIEEPETSQHPDNQKMLMKAFQELSEDSQSQVIFTTHTPMLVSYIDENCIRYIKNKTIVNLIDESDKKEIAKNLGVLPDHNVKLFIGVEGTNDINFLKNIAKLIAQNNNDAIDLDEYEQVGKIVFIPFGGSSFKLWINRLNNLNIPEFHICDRDNEPPLRAHYQDVVDNILVQPFKRAVITKKRELENYIHIDAIINLYQQDRITINSFEINDFDDIPLIVAQKVHEYSDSTTDWDSVKDEKKKSKISKVKQRLNECAIPLMSYEQYCEADVDKEIESWLVEMKGIIHV